eukprot:COSAG02_NODE_209_length_28965_cov_18.680143_19_plen_1324_part_00
MYHDTCSFVIVSTGIVLDLQYIVVQYSTRCMFDVASYSTYMQQVHLLRTTHVRIEAVVAHIEAVVGCQDWALRQAGSGAGTETGSDAADRSTCSGASAAMCLQRSTCSEDDDGGVMPGMHTQHPALLTLLLLQPSKTLPSSRIEPLDATGGRVPAPHRRFLAEQELQVSTEELLRPAFEWNSGLPASQRYRTIVTHSELETVGTVLVQQLDNPKEQDALAGFIGDSLNPLDVLTAFPAPDAPATTRIRVDLGEHVGANRLHAFVRVNAEQCSHVELANSTHNFTRRQCVPSYDAPAEVVSAVLAPDGDPSAVIRHVELRLADYSTLPGEWHEVLGDFYVLPYEFGTGSQRIKLFVTLGSPNATVGTVSMTDLTLTSLPLTNVALGKPIAEGGSVSSRSAGYIDPPENDILTDGVITGQPWYTIDQMQPPTPIKFVVELVQLHHVCGVRVEFIGTSSHVTDWMVHVSEFPGGYDTSGLSNFSQVLRVQDEAWQDWASQRLANPISTKQRWFPCTDARRVRVQLTSTQNAIFGLTEIEVYGYSVATYGMCSDRCRHGGRCMHAAQRCTCPRKWGWRGSTCDVDVDECTLSSESQIAKERVPTIVHENGGCGQGDPLKANCTNSPGSWACDCNPGFSGQSSEGMSNVCNDIDECLTDRGGCEHICINSIGSYACDCRSGFATAFDHLELDEEMMDDWASWSDEQREPYEPTRHMVSHLPLLGAACEPVCVQPCVHGGECVSPDRCAPCDPGWQGNFCDKEICEVERTYRNAAGELVEDLGCYHGGRCLGVGLDCVECKGGWTGRACHMAPGGLVVLGLAATAALGIIPCIAVIVVKRSWLPFQERGIALLLVGSSSALVVVLGSPASANAWWYGVGLEPFDKQPESSFWAVWLPGTMGYSLWLNSLIVRMRNLATIHLKGATPYATVFQLGALWLPWLIASVPGGAASNVLWLVVLAVMLLYVIMLSLQLRYLRNDLDDYYPNVVAGVGTILLSIANNVLQLIGLSYANPEGMINIFYPVCLIGLCTFHYSTTTAVLVYKLVRKDKDIIRKYNRDDDNDDNDDDTKDSWKGKLRGSRSVAVLRLSTVDDAGAVGVDYTSSESESVESTSEESESESESEPVPQPELESSSDSSEEEPPHPRVYANRGRGRGHRWSRGGRSRGRGRTRATIGSLAKADPAVQSGEKPTSRLTYGDVRPMRSAAELLTAVATGAAQTAERIDADDSTSSDEELEDLAAEVKRFEQLMEKTSALPGVVPKFDAIPEAASRLDRIPLDLTVKRRALTKEQEREHQVRQEPTPLSLPTTSEDLTTDSSVEDFLRQSDAATA